MSPKKKPGFENPSCSVTSPIQVGEYATITATGLDPSEKYSMALHATTYSAYSVHAYPYPDGSLVWGAYQYAAGPGTGEVRRIAPSGPTVVATCDYMVE